MEAVTKKNYCAFMVHLEGSADEGETSVQSMQEAFEKFRRRRQVRAKCCGFDPLRWSKSVK